jgi:DNA polymerase-3 subunit beta
MKAILPRQELFDALGAVVQVASARTPKPILNCVHLVLDKERLVLLATDGETGLRVGVGALSVKKPGQVVVPAERLLSIVRELGDAELALEADERQCFIRGQGSEFKIYTASTVDFPPVAGFDGEADLTLDGADLRRMTVMTIYAAARETSRFAINGVLWEKQGKRLYMVATDGRRLARAGVALRDAKAPDFEAIIPARALAIFERVFAPKSAELGWQVQVKLAPNQVVLRSEDRVLSTVLVEGHFPKYQDVIPKGQDKRARVQRDELHAAVRRAGLLTTEESRAIRLSFQPNQLVITSQAPEQGEARIELPIQYEGAPLEIGFNPTFLSEALKVVPFEEVFVELQESFRPGLVCGEDKSEFLYVIMPVQL